MKINVSEYMNKYIFFSKLSKNVTLKKILSIMSDALLIITFALSLSLEAIRPFNYIIIIVFGLFIFSSSMYIMLYGVFSIDFFIILLISFLFLQIVSTTVNIFPYFTQTPILMCLLSFFVYQYFYQIDNKSKIIKYLLASSLFFVLCFTFVYIKDLLNPNFSIRLGSVFGNENDVARHMSFAFISTLILVFKFKKPFYKIIFSLVAIYCFYLILTTGSISNILVDLICVCIFIYFLLPPKKKWVFFVLLIAFVISVFIVINLPSLSYFKKRILGMLNSFFGIQGNYYRDTSSEGRFFGAYYGLKLFFQNPIFGNGYRSVFRNFYIMSHNNITEIAADFGVLALLIYETIIIYPLLKKENRDLEIVLFNTFIFLFQFFLVAYTSKIESILLAITFSLCYSSATKTHNTKNIEKSEYWEINV